HPFIITLGTNAIFRGITLVISDANSVYGFSFDFVNFFAATPLGIPVPVIFSLIVALILWFLTTRMRVGRNIYALGGNKNSAFYSGIDVKFHMLLVFIISGICAGLAGVVSTARLGAAEPLAGMGFETYAIASAIIGGTSFFGGKGRIFSVVIGGLIIGTILWSCFKPLDFSLVHATPWLHLPTLMPFAKPEFHIIPVALLSMVMVVVMVETMSSMMATGDIVGKKVDAKMLRNGLNTCGIATTICGFFNLFPYAAFAQNVGLIGLTGVRSRFVVSVSGIILILMGVFSRMAALVVLIPKPILGGAGIVMFGMVAVSGIRTLGQVNYRNNNNGMVVALTLGLGMMPVLVPNLFT
ncbi:solute carrier family 23 protein, partial [Aeromonas caviae]